MRAAVGVRGPLPQNPGPDSSRRSGSAHVGAALAATRPLQSAGSDAGRRRGQKTPPTEPWPGLEPQIWLSPCGSGLGRDTAAAVRGLRCRPLSGSEDPSHRTPARTQAADLSQFLWERPWPRHDRGSPQASMQAAVGVRRPLPQNPGPDSSRRSGSAPVGAALAATRPLQSAGFDTGRSRGQKTPPTEPRPGRRRVQHERGGSLTLLKPAPPAGGYGVAHTPPVRTP